MLNASYLHVAYVAWMPNSACRQHGTEKTDVSSRTRDEERRDGIAAQKANGDGPNQCAVHDFLSSRASGSAESRERSVVRVVHLPVASSVGY